jgi:ATP-dependent exoDNAse (exonuclease V) alpha subunit
MLQYVKDNKLKNIIVKSKYTNNSKKNKSIKNQRFIVNLDNFNGEKQELAFATTIHSVQGKTIKQQIFLVKKRFFNDKLLNVALSRNTKLDSLYIL